MNEEEARVLYQQIMDFAARKALDIMADDIVDALTNGSERLKLPKDFRVSGQRTLSSPSDR